MSFPASILLPLLRQNGAYLERAVRSALDQTVPAEVLVVVSEHTPRSNLDVIERIGRDAPSLRVIQQARKGFAAALNAGIAAASTPRIGFLLTDDWLEADAIETCLPFDADIVSAGVTTYAADGVTRLPAISRLVHQEDYERRQTLEARADYLTHFLLLRKDLIERAGGVEEGIGDSPGVDDFDLIWTMLEQGATVGLPGRSVYCYRDHEGERLTLRDPAEMRATFELILDKHRVTGAEREAILAKHVPWFGRPILTAHRELRGDETLVRAEPRLWWVRWPRSTVRSPPGRSHLEDPRISIVIPTFNQGRYLGRAIESVLTQTGVRPDVIVIDDGSTDETARVVEPYLDRVRYVRQPNQGVAAARNHGLGLAQADSVAFLDSDDYLVPGALAMLHRELATRPTLGALQGGVVVVDEHGKQLWTENLWHDAPVLDLKTCIWRKPAALKTMLVRREWAKRIGGFDVVLPSAQDVDFVIRLVAAGCHIDWVRQPIVYYRQHTASMSRNAVAEAEAIEAIHDKFFARADVPPALRREESAIRFYSLVWCAWRMACSGQIEQVAEWLQRSFVHTSYSPDQTVVEWAQQFTSYDAHTDRATVGVDCWSPAVHAAADAVQASWEIAEAWLSWWVRVWSHYLEGREARAVEGLAAYHKIPLREVVALARDSLLLSPLERRIALADRFWADAQTSGLVDVAQARAAAGLYLPIFGRAVRTGEHDLARRALKRAVGVGIDRVAMAAWFQFLRSALPHQLKRN